MNFHYSSPNYEIRAAEKKPYMIVIHYTGMKTSKEAIERLCEPSSKVSAHYLVEEDGSVYCLVDEKHRAWHAGVSEWEGETDINSVSIGIELVNPGHEHGYREFPLVQMQALSELCKGIMERHEIEVVLGHSDVAPGRKMDPGELFDWIWLGRSGVENIHSK